MKQFAQGCRNQDSSLGLLPPKSVYVSPNSLCGLHVNVAFRALIDFKEWEGFDRQRKSTLLKM